MAAGSGRGGGCDTYHVSAQTAVVRVGLEIVARAAAFGVAGGADGGGGGGGDGGGGYGGGGCCGCGGDAPAGAGAAVAGGAGAGASIGGDAAGAHGDLSLVQGSGVALLHCREGGGRGDGCGRGDRSGVERSEMLSGREWGCEVGHVEDLRDCWRNGNQHEAGTVFHAGSHVRHFPRSSTCHCSSTVIGIAAGEDALDHSQS